MKKIWMLLLFLCACMLSACSNQRTVYGKVVEINTDKETGVVSFVVQEGEKKETGVLMTEDTFVGSFVSGLEAEDFKAGVLTDVTVSVSYNAFRKALVKKDGQRLKAYEAKQIWLTGYKLADIMALEDGTAVDVWQYQNDTDYLLQNGVELLRVDNPVGPETSVSGMENLGDLKEEAQQKILEFYEKQGLLYDTEKLLEQAYDSYKENAEAFEAYMASQEIHAEASNDEIISFLTAVYRPGDDGQLQEYQSGAVFLKATGEYTDAGKLFSCSWEEASERLLELSKIEDEALKEVMKQVLRPENLIFMRDGLELFFEPGSLPGQEYSYVVFLDYNGELLEILHEWAVLTKN